MDTETEYAQADNTGGKRSECNCFCGEYSTTLTQFWQIYQQMKGNDRTKTNPDLADTNGARLTTNEEKGQAYLGDSHLPKIWLVDSAL